MSGDRCQVVVSGDDSYYLLNMADNRPASFTVHLHTEHWTINNSAKFLYHSQIAVCCVCFSVSSQPTRHQCILDDIRAHRIPVDFLDLFDAADVPFYDGMPSTLCLCYPHTLLGCMIVDLFDYRTRNEKPPRTRVLLHPDSESLWTDICSLNVKHNANCTDLDALHIEAKILVGPFHLPLFPCLTHD